MSSRLARALAALAMVACLALPAGAFADVAPEPGVAPISREPVPAVIDAAASRTLFGIDAADVILLLWLFLAPLGLTLLVEVPVIGAFGGFRPRVLGAGALVNTLTNPLLVFVLLEPTALFGVVLEGPGALALLVALELAVVAGEWALLRWALGWSGRKALTASLVANLASVGIGMALGFGTGFLYL